MTNDQVWQPACSKFRSWPFLPSQGCSLASDIASHAAFCREDKNIMDSNGFEAFPGSARAHSLFCHLPPVACKTQAFSCYITVEAGNAHFPMIFTVFGKPSYFQCSWAWVLMPWLRQQVWAAKNTRIPNVFQGWSWIFRGRQLGAFRGLQFGRGLGKQEMLIFQWFSRYLNNRHFLHFFCQAAFCWKARNIRNYKVFQAFPGSARAHSFFFAICRR